MKKLLILSGKGGTGKTTIAAAFIRFAQARAYADCDVAAPNLHIVINTQGAKENASCYGNQKAFINPDQCCGCGNCASACRFGAIFKMRDGIYAVNWYACEGCGVCAAVCVPEAAKLGEDVSAELTLYRGERVFSTGEVRIGRGASGKVVNAVKAALTNAAPFAELAIMDGSPGIGGPVMAAITGADLALVVTEPSLSGFCDLKRILQLSANRKTKAAVCINQYDTCLEAATRIERYCRQYKIPFVGRIPYESQAYAAVNAGKSLADVDCPARAALYEAYEKVLELLYPGDAADQ